MINEQSDAYRLNRDLEKVTLRLVMEPQAHVPDTMTRIRVLSSVAVVGQQEKVERTQAKSAILDVYVKYLPKSGGVYENIVSLCKLIKALPGVRIVKVKSVGGKGITHKGRPIVI